MTLKQTILTILAFFILVSCEENAPDIKTGQLEISFSDESISSGGRIGSTAASILVSIRNAEGTAVHTKGKIALYKFGDDYLSEPIALTAGDFTLTEFIVLDDQENAIYATPLEGSPLAHLVDDPLPINFAVTKNATTKISPQVIRIEGNTADDFGYATFGLDIVGTFTFSAGILAYDPVSKNFELTTAQLEVLSGGESLFNRELAAITNSIRIEDDHDNYTIRVSKAGYTPYERTFSEAALKEHLSGPPLVITLLAESLTEGLIAYYPFNGDADDETGNNFDGIVHEAALTTDRHGDANAAYSFDGLNDYIQVPHDDALNLTSNFTISLWAEISNLQEPENGINDILRKWTGNAEGYPFSISYLNPLADDATEDRILFARYDGQVCDNALETHSPTITNDTFVHIVMVKDGEKVRTYLNNALASDVNDPVACSTANTADMTIGCRGNLVRFFKGKIDNIRIYNRALNETELGHLAGE